MKILMFGWEYPPHISGGLGTACYGMTKALVSLNNVEISFVVPRAFGDEDKNIVRIIDAGKYPLSKKSIRRLNKIKLVTKGEKTITISAYSSPSQYQEALKAQGLTTKNESGTSTTEMLGLSGGYGADLYSEINKYGIIASDIATEIPHDIIHAHDWLTFIAGVEARRASGRPLIVHVHATEFDRSGENYNRKVFEIEKYGMMEADKVIAVSNLTRNTIISRYHIPPEKVITIHNGVESPQYTAGRISGLKGNIVTYLGRITYQKGPEYFIEAARLILKRLDNVHFVMAGSGDMMQRMVSMAANYGIMGNFYFTGFLKGPEVTEILAASDIFVMPSVSEPFGIVPLEAMQNNVPVIISKQSGVSEVLQHAIKIDFWNTHAMADAIYGILAYPSLKEHLAHNGHKEVRKINWEEAAVKINSLYSTMISHYA